MKKVFLILGIIFFFSAVFSLKHLNAQSSPVLGDIERTISMDFQDASLKNILKALSIQAELNFIASEAVQDRTVTLYLDKVPLSEAMNKIFSANNLTYELDPKANIFVVKDWGKMEAETVTQVFYLKYASVSSSSIKEEMSNNLRDSSDFTTGESGSSSSSSESGGGSGGDSGKWKAEEDSGITATIKKLLSPTGSVIEDYRTNSLIVTDNPAKMEVIKKVIASLDIPATQVLLEVEMLDVSKNAVDAVGFQFGSSPLTAIITGATASTGFPYGSITKLVDKGLGELSINPEGSTYGMQLDFLRTQTDTKFLARPKIFTLNNETAEVRIATNESIGVIVTTTSSGGSTGTTTSEAERTQTGVILRVTPQIDVESGQITMFVYPKVAEAIQGNSFINAGDSYQFRDPEERSTKSVVRIKDGETVVLGGLIRNEIYANSSKLPFLGDIPIIGMFFRHKGGDGEKNKQRELLVFITPHIIKEKTDTKVSEIKNLQLPVREQGVPVAANRDGLINAYMNKIGKKN